MDDDRVVRSTNRIEEFVARKAEEQDVKKRRVDFENSERQFEEPSADKRDDAENSGMDFDGEREREREGPPRPLEGGDEQGLSKKPRLLTWEDVAKKIEDGVCAGAEDMKIDGVLVNGLEVNQDEEYAADEWVFDELNPRPGARRSATWRKNWTCSPPPLGMSASRRRAGCRYRPSWLTLTRAWCRTR